jgi:hypothetical protein
MRRASTSRRACSPLEEETIPKPNLPKSGRDPKSGHQRPLRGAEFGLQLEIELPCPI